MLALMIGAISVAANAQEAFDVKETAIDDLKAVFATVRAPTRSTPASAPVAPSHRSRSSEAAR